MPRPGPCRADHFPSSATWRLLWPCALLALAGCQTAAVQVAAESEEPVGWSRSLTLSQQVAADSGRYLVHHPLRSGWEWLYEAADHLCCLTQGEMGKRLLLPLAGTPGPLFCHSDVLDGLALENELHGFAGKVLEPAWVHLYPDGHEALAALEQLIDAATCRLDVLMFEWEDDAVGRALVERLAARAAAGVRVRVLVDGGGNLIFGWPDDAPSEVVNRAVADLARQPNVALRRTQNPFARFDHRKLVVADGRRVWTGGRNFVCRAFAKHRDLSLTLDGPLVAEIDEHFESFWQEQGDGTEWPHLYSESTSLPAAIVGLSTSISRENATSSLTPNPSPLTPDSWPEEPANCWARLLYTEPADHQLQRGLHRAIDRAQHHVYAENVYFTDAQMLCKLIRARRRGADVRVILTVESTSRPINRANRVTANRLLKAGVRVFLYPGMTHAKAAVVDGCWAYVGTGNLDPLSLRHNHELGLAIAAGPVIEDLEQRLFLPAFQPDWELHEPLPVSLGDYVCELVAGLCL